MDAREKEIHDQRVTIEAKVLQRVEQLCKALERRGEALVGELDHLTQQKLKNLATQKEEINTIQVQYSSCLEDVENSLKTDTEGEKLATKASTLDHIQQRTPKIDPDKLYPHETANMVMVEDDASSLTEACCKFAKITTLDPI